MLQCVVRKLAALSGVTSELGEEEGGINGRRSLRRFDEARKIVHQRLRFPSLILTFRLSGRQTVESPRLQVKAEPEPARCSPANHDTAQPRRRVAGHADRFQAMKTGLAAAKIARRRTPRIENPGTKRIAPAGIRDANEKAFCAATIRCY